MLKWDYQHRGDEINGLIKGPRGPLRGRVTLPLYDSWHIPRRRFSVNSTCDRQRNQIPVLHKSLTDIVIIHIYTSNLVSVILFEFLVINKGNPWRNSSLSTTRDIWACCRSKSEVRRMPSGTAYMHTWARSRTRSAVAAERAPCRAVLRTPIRRWRRARTAAQPRQGRASEAARQGWAAHDACSC